MKELNQFYSLKTSPLILMHLQITIDGLCWCLMTRQPLWVILCRLPEKGRKEIEEIVEEIVEEMNERDRG